MPTGERRHRGDRRGHRRPALGVPPRSARGRVPARRRQLAQQPQHRHLRPASSSTPATTSYVFGLDAATGEIVWETQIFDYRETPAGHSSGPIIADGKVISGPELPAARRARVVRHRRPRRAHRRGAVAAADGAGSRRAGRRDLGRRALRAAGPRRLVDAGQLRPRAATDLPGHVGHLAGPQSSCSAASRTRTCTTTRRWPSTSTPARSAGTTST